MSGKLVSLSKARKSRARDAARKQADENAVKHGRPKAARDRNAARKALADKRVDGHKRDE
ncbi:DUF4169 family protein [Gymnodinialimonas ulvae]|uniref:DUF4169 family protein n=1 Tax=Gymnodinialimonas ulvae TaxID=3126504 RepID=UPI0030AFE11B